MTLNLNYQRILSYILRIQQQTSTMDVTFTISYCMGKYIYILFKFFAKMYNDCVDKKNKTVCAGECKCKKGCENCRENIFRNLYLV